MANSGRQIADQTTPEARLAVVAQRIQRHFNKSGTPDFADYRDAMRLYVQKELLLARIDEARRCGGLVLTARIAELAVQLSDIEHMLPAEVHVQSVAR